jgi:uncharacterized protein (DUF2062 family)
MRHYFDLKGFAKRSLERLHQIRDAPHAVAGGVAVGMFWGFTPLTGLKTLLSLATAWMMRCSRLSAVIAVALHDVLLPIWPVILRWEYQIGFWILNHPHELPPKLAPHKLHLTHLMSWHTTEILWRTFVGSLVIGIPISLVFYWLVLKLLARYEATHHRQLQAPP